MTASEKQELERLRDENQKLKLANVATITKMKVSEKGAVSIYGLGRFPVTLYAGQWEALLAKSQDILDFIQVNNGRLSRK